MIGESFLTTIKRWFEPASQEKDLVASADEEQLRLRLRERCNCFRDLLSANKTALESMSEMESLPASQKPFTMYTINNLSTKVTDSVEIMVNALNVLSEQAYAALNTPFANITAQIKTVSQPEQKNDCPLILPVKDIRLADSKYVGSKMANLGEISANLGLAIPNGFAATTGAYAAFMAHQGLGATIERMCAEVDMANFEELFNVATKLQKLILAADLPNDLRLALEDAVKDLQAQEGSDLTLALRSSAIGEDARGMSFAGQYHSELNVDPKDCLRVYKEIIASKYTVTAMSYRYQHGIPDDAVPMCVGVLTMLPAIAGGVAYSLDPLPKVAHQEQILLNVVPGSAQGVVDGSTKPDSFEFSRSDTPELLGKTINNENYSFPEDMARKLAKLTLDLEAYYKEPQDVEWVLHAKTHQLVILQTRPLKTDFSEPEDTKSEAQTRPLGTDFPILAQGGVAVSHGVGLGATFVARTEADMLSFPSGAILVVERALPRWAPLLPKASGLISENGGLAGHLATVAREYHLPAIFGLQDACAILENQTAVTIDTNTCTVYGGLNKELKHEVDHDSNPMLDSLVYQRLAQINKLITPLNLLDPTASNFAPQYCESLHDITRFCHEKAVQHLFETDPLSRKMGKQLEAGAKLQYWLIDMGGGFWHDVHGKTVKIDEIKSLPMLALWDGMIAFPWAGPPTSTSGFMSVMLQSTMNPDLEATAPNAMAQKNFFIVSDSYMIMQARYGYHFCTVESSATSNSHENFVHFQFKGGAADHERRHLRASLVAEILDAHGFRASVKEDGMFAEVENCAADDILQKTRLLGYLLIHTRQVDTIMLEVERVAALHTKLTTDMQELLTKPLPKNIEKQWHKG